jgi:hypothetical protein
LEHNSYYFSFALFLGSVWLRLIGMNGDGYVLASYFIGLTVVAAATSRVFTGRTWCHYFCPVMFLEKFYTEASRVGTGANSRCSSCTGCKKACPDINQEKSYWEELPLPAKRFAYFCFPGVVIGFSVYGSLQSGDWKSVFGGSAGQQPGLVGSAFLPGHSPLTAGFFFLPDVPRALAAALTLAGCCLGSYIAFSVVERFLRRRGPQSSPSVNAESARHRLFAVGAFLAFVTFYGFVSAVVFRTSSWAGAALLLGVVALALVTLVRRLGRTRQAGLATPRNPSAVAVGGYIEVRSVSQRPAA